MKAVALLLALSCAAPAFANHRTWQDATVAAINSQANDNGAAVVPVGGALYGVRLRSTTLWYTIETPDVTYVLAQVIQGRKHPLNVTLHGKTKIAIDGSSAHILDDAGKDVKLAIVRKTERVSHVRRPQVVQTNAVVAPDQGRPKWDGTWWQSTTPGFKLGWVTGYGMAMDSAAASKMGACLPSIPLYRDKYPDADPKDFVQKLCFSDSSLDYDGIAMGQFVDGIDDFYRDYRNRQISVGWAIEYVRDAIKGKPAGELESEVVMWRRCSAAYESGDTEQMKTACTPEPATPPQK